MNIYQDQKSTFQAETLKKRLRIKKSFIRFKMREMTAQEHSVGSVQYAQL